MTIAHHPDEDLLAAYAAGSLDLGQRVAIATHLKACESCRDWVRAMEQVGGAMIADTAPAALTEGALARALARIDEPPPVARARPLCGDAPENLPRFVKAYEFGRWRRIAPRIAMRPIRLPEPGPTRVFLLKAAGGTKVIEHAHTGLEMTCVLAGAFRREGERYGPGDFDFGDGDIHHEPRVEEGDDCVSLVAIKGELRWQGLLGRLIQPFVRL
ncbi:MAG TPA: ChrR family anti-sigma-E factor [Roseiarcus sp.]|nr:ChrR family anti-sigma-E factor [Roseiarcus sp.]